MKKYFLSLAKWGVGACVGILLTGCSGGGGGGSSSSPAQSPGASQNVTPGSISGDVLTLSVPGENDRQITFSEGGNWQETRDNTTVTGTYSYQANTDGRTAVINLTEPTFAEALTLTFASTTAGTFTYSSGRTGQGSFMLAPTQPNPDPGPDPNPPPQTGKAPDSLKGMTMLGTRTYTSTGPVGQTHTYTFAASSFHDSDPPEESDGNYTYEPSGDTASLVLTYTRPQSFRGDRHDIHMKFDTPTQGSFISTYDRGDGTIIEINGTFQIQ